MLAHLLMLGSLALSVFFGQPDDWSIDIVPSLSMSEGIAAVSLNETFHVVLSNCTGHDLILCDDPYYGGENDLYLVCTSANGTTITLRPQKPYFFTHPPTFYVVHSAGHYVFAIHLNGQKEGNWPPWTTDPQQKTIDVSPVLNRRDLTVVAIFSHPSPEPSMSMGVPGEGVKISSWAGEVRSKPLKLMFLP